MPETTDWFSFQTEQLHRRDDSGVSLRRPGRTTGLSTINSLTSMRHLLRTAAAGIALASGVVFGACSEKTTENPVLSEIAVTVAKPTVSIADTVRATATGKDQNGRAMPVGDVTWSATGAATVSQSGLITGVSLGTATIRATVTGRAMFAEVTVTVGPKAATRLAANIDFVTTRNKPFSLLVQLVDADNQGVRQAGVPITLAFAGGGTITGPLTATTNTFGEATFANLSIDGASGPKTFTFSSPGLTAGTTKVTVVSGVASKIEVAYGNNQSYPKGESTLPLGFRVTDVDGYPVAGVPVTFTITSGTGTLGVQSAVTESDGVAGSGQWTLRSVGPHTMRATAQGVATSVTANATGLPSLSSISISLSAPTVAVGETIKATVIGLDDSGAPFLPSGWPVEWNIVGGILVSADGSVTGTGAGNASLIATVRGVRTSIAIPVTGAVTRALRVVTFPTSVTSGTALSTEPSVRLVDANNQPIAEAGHVVTASVVGPLLTPEATSLAVNILNGTQTAVTDNTGVARFPGLSTIARSRQFALIFRASGALPVQSVYVPVLPGAATTITLVPEYSQSAVTGTAVSTAPAVRITDSAGNAVAGVTVNFVVASGGGTVTGGTATTDASGRATVGSWRLGAVGTNTLTASSPAFAGAVTFTATARPF